MTTTRIRALRRSIARGFTLVELLVAMALMTVVSTILATIMQQAQTMYDISTSQSHVITGARIALDEIGRDLAYITPLDTPIPAGFQIRGIEGERVPYGDVDHGDTNVEIERPLALTLRSPGYEQLLENWNREEEFNDHYVDWAQGRQAADAEVSRRAFLSFYTSAMTLVTGDGAQPRVDRAPVFAEYFLMARPPREVGGIDRQQPGAYLMRRIRTYRWVQTVEGGWQCNWGPTNEEDICAFVRGVTVRYFDRDYDTTTSGRDVKFIEARAEPEMGPSPQELDNERFEAPDAFGRLWNEEENAVRFMLDPDWWELNLSEPFTQKSFLPPAIEVSLLVCSDDGMTNREVSRVYRLPVAPPALPRKPN